MAGPKRQKMSRSESQNRKKILKAAQDAQDARLLRDYVFGKDGIKEQRESKAKLNQKLQEIMGIEKDKPAPQKKKAKKKVKPEKRGPRLVDFKTKTVKVKFKKDKK